MEHLYDRRIKWVEDYLEKIKLDNDLQKYYRGRNILVAGGAGAIGSNLIIALANIGCLSAFASFEYITFSFIF